MYFLLFPHILEDKVEETEEEKEKEEEAELNRKYFQNRVYSEEYITYLSSRLSDFEKKQSCHIQYLIVFLALAILFEGDLRLSRAEVEGLKENTISKKDAIASEAGKWPNARVPYIISKKFGNQLSILRGGNREI